MSQYRVQCHIVCVTCCVGRGGSSEGAGGEGLFWGVDCSPPGGTGAGRGREACLQKGLHGPLRLEKGPSDPCPCGRAACPCVGVVATPPGDGHATAIAALLRGPAPRAVGEARLSLCSTSPTARWTTFRGAPSPWGTPMGTRCSRCACSKTAWSWRSPTSPRRSPSGSRRPLTPAPPATAFSAGTVTPMPHAAPAPMRICFRRCVRVPA